MFCLREEYLQSIKKAIKEGKFDMAKFNKDSQTRRDMLSEIVGKENAEQVNTLFEKKLLLKNQEATMFNFIKDITGLSAKAKEEMAIKAAERIAERQRRIYNPKDDEVMLNEIASDIYSKKYGNDVSLEQAQTITELAQDLREAKKEMNPDFTWKSEEGKFKAGATERALNNYVGHIKAEVQKPGFINPLKEKGVGNKVGAVIENARVSANFIAETSRAIVAGVLDNSFWGNQGIKVLWNPATSKIWAKNFVKSFSDIGQILKHGVKEGDKIMDGIYADFYTRQNRLNGRYEAKVEVGKRGKRVDIGSGEEEIPTDVMTKLGEIPVISKIPILKQVFEVGGRLAKAANVAYEAGAMRLRMDIADKYYAWSEKAGRDMNNNYEIGSINTIINSLTGRGSIGSFEKAGKPINLVVFSIKFAKSNVDFLTAHWLDKNVSTHAKITASKNLLTVASMIYVTLGIAKSLDPESTDLDPRSRNYGKIYGQDISGGMGSYLTLASRIAMQSTKNAKTGIITRLGSGYGQMNGMDIFWQFLENKTAPLMSVVKDMVKQETFEGKKPTLGTETASLTTPMGLSNTIDIAKEKDAGLLLKLIGGGLNLIGLNKNVYDSDIDWSESTSKELSQFHEKVGDKKFKDANDQFNKKFYDWFDEAKNNPKFTALTDDRKKDLLQKKKDEIKKEVFRKNNFVVRKEKQKPLPKL